MAPVYLWPLTAFGYAILVYTLSKLQSWKRAGLTTFLFFFGYHICGLYWVSASLFVDFDTWWWALPFSSMGLPIACALFPTLFVTIASLSPKYRGALFIIALAYADYVRGFLFTGFVWNNPIHGLVNNDIVMSVLPHVGFYLLNALIIACFCLPHIFNKRLIIAIYAGVIGLLYVSPMVIHLPVNPVTQPPHNTILVQANIAQKDKWNSDLVMGNLAKYIKMSQSAVNENNAYVIIWPETALSQNLLSYPQANAMVADFLNGVPQGSVLITGLLNSHDGRYYNSLVAFNTNGEIIARFDKHHLVPFGEYMPLGLGTITGFDGFSAGEKPATMHVGEITFLPLICYEIIFPEYSHAAMGSDFILNITNDSWFGNTAGPYQHLDHARLRAIENNKPVLRLSGNGISGWVNESGEIINRTLLNHPAIIKF